jgi:hypothetical protein
MIKKFLLIGTITTFLSFTHISYADIQLYSNDENVCSSIAGNWIGTGTVQNPLIGVCRYHGIGTISLVDEVGHFNLKLNTEKDSGSLLCPSHSESVFNGTCLNGAIKLSTPYGDLSGTLSGNTGIASGTLRVSPGINADVVVKFNR